MKVAILSPYPTFPFAQQLGCQKVSYGNNATWTVSLAQWLAKMPDTEVHVLTESDDIPCSKNISAEGAIIHFIKVPARFKTLTLWQFDRLRLHRILDEIRPDIVHGQGIESQYGYAAVTARYPCILTIHGLSKLSNRVLDIPWLSRVRLVELFEWYCMRKARNIIVINPFIAEVLGLTSSRYNLFTIPNAIGERYFAAPSEPREDNLLLSIGYTDRLKAHDVLARAMALLRQRKVACRAIIAGPLNEGEFLESLRKYIRDESLDIQFAGYMSSEKLLPLLLRCTALVHPSRHDNSPVALGEAMATGTPVVASRVGGIPNIIQDNVTGLLFDSEDAVQLADKLQYLLENKPARHQLAENGREFARKTYHPSHVAALTRAAYQEILSNL
jgi:glycosyltransferase involved in cell wall biosynthesis